MNEIVEDWFGRGKGDPDVYGYPGEKQKFETPKVYSKKHWSEIVRNPNSTFEPRDFGDNHPASPEQGWA